ncbi:ribonuclease HII [bacterium]|nr:MAG: ribonuclease HII [bacterium]
MAKRPNARFNLENSLQRDGYRRVAGVDEVGRGCLAGPVCAAAVVLDPDVRVTGLRDSKLLSAKARERLYDEIIVSSDWSVSEVSVTQIDQLNIQKASLLAMRKAVMALKVPPDFVIVDGVLVPELPFPRQAIIGGDRKCASIAAASIVAKVTRDRLMICQHEKEPRYGFDRHKGYPTAIHLDALEMYGYSELHRRSFRPRRLLSKPD